jgi:serine/threonine protein kinase
MELNRSGTETDWQENNLTEIDRSPAESVEATPWAATEAAMVPNGPLPAAPTAGRLLGKYVMYEEIAHGGMASVHLGRGLEPSRAVAIKHLFPQLAWSPRSVAMFLDEGRLAARVRHPNVVAPIDFVVPAHEGELYLVLEYVHGETLSELLRRAARRDLHPSPAAAVGIMVGALQGLHAAHEATTDEGKPLEIVHRDVSPQNIMVGVDGVARVLDFGVATAKVQSGKDDELRGKPSYLAPEQIANQNVDRRADVFAAGVVLWEMLARRRLFGHTDARVMWTKILSGDIPPPSRFNPGVPTALDVAVIRATARDPQRRYPDALAFARAITQALPPDGADRVGAWVEEVSGDVLADRAERLQSIMSGERERPPRQRRARLVDVIKRLGSQASWVTDGRRLTAVGLCAALVGMAGWSAGSKALRQPHAPPALAAAMMPVPIEAPPVAPPSTPEEPAPPPRATEEVVPIEPTAAVEPQEQDEQEQQARPPRTHRKHTLARIGSLNDRALRAYRKGRIDTAQRLLRAALQACAKAGPTAVRLEALTHTHLGVVLVDGYQQQQLGIEQFRRALRLDPAVPLARRWAKPEVVAAFREAVVRT